jgi:hypothetical protein
MLFAGIKMPNNILKEYEEKKRINDILDKHSNLNFVQRIRNPNIFPIISEGDTGWATHRMSYATTDNGAMVYPNIIQDDNGKLVELPPNEALNYAIKTKQFIPFDNPLDADWFGKNYKKVWEKK